MRFSVFSVLDDDPELRTGHRADRYEEALGQVRGADRDGFETFWVAEHHFHHGGVLPAPPVWLAAAARETRRVRLGVMVAVLPLHQPRELAEQYALVDRLSGGRLEIGVGAGYIPQELEGFGLSPGQRRDRFDAALPEFVAALRGEPLAVSVHPGATVTLNVRPVQQPHPPLWMAAQRREALPFVSKRGLPVALIPYASVAGLDELARNIREYRAQLPNGGAAGRVAAAFHVFVGSRTAGARAALQRYLDSRIATGSSNYEARISEAPDMATVDGLDRRGLVLIGEGSQLVPKVAAIEKAGVTDLLGIFDFGGLPPSVVAGSMRRFSEAFGLRK
ncbi:MAG: LLM class flavin-dependent oxidoreductase [Euryarchaeota archaeon]|nr:LLM class flavin-dependent oxidoreductase [Euryarchaeota archaeon]